MKIKESEKIYEAITTHKKAKQIHWKFRIGNFRFSFFKLRKKFCVRLEISSKGWE